VFGFEPTTNWSPFPLKSYYFSRQKGTASLLSISNHRNCEPNEPAHCSVPKIYVKVQVCRTNYPTWVHKTNNWCGSFM